MDTPGSLLALPLPTRRSTALAALRALPQRVLQLVAASLWIWLLVAATYQLLSHGREVLYPPPAAPPPPPRASHLYTTMAWLLGWAGAADATASGSEAARGEACWLVIHITAAAAARHHLACRHRLRDTSVLRTPSLQSALLQTAALQLQAAAIPVGAHALGLVPHSLASAYTTLPLCSTPTHAAAFCAAFLAANAFGAWLYLPAGPSR